MPVFDSTNLAPPDLGQDQPTYPPLPEIVRVTGPALAGINPPIYPAYVQQCTAPGVFRDREPCYLTEANAIALNPGRYLARLNYQYSGLPVFTTACCPGPASSSSSSSRSGR